jgi:hypothetical protein
MIYLLQKRLLVLSVSMVNSTVIAARSSSRREIALVIGTLTRTKEENLEETH